MIGWSDARSKESSGFWIASGDDVEISTVIGIAIAVCVLFGGALVAGIRSAAAFLWPRLTRLPSLGGIFSAKLELEWWKVGALLLALWFVSGGVTWHGCKLPSVPGFPWPIVSTKPTLIVLLYEADYGEPPAYAAGAVNELRKSGRIVRMMDDDPATGINTVPAEVAPAIELGRKIMGGTDGKGYALVLLSGPRVIKAIALPTSKEAILEACR